MNEVMMHRRNFLTLSGLAGFATLPAIGEVLRQSFNIVDFGAQPGGRVLNTRYLQKAIDHAFEAGGGAVSVPPGIFLAGGLVLRSRVTLYLQAGAVLRGSTDVNDYEYHAGPPQEGDANGRHLIFARDAEDIAIVGQGTIDGQGSAFWHRKGRPRPKPEEMWGDVIAWDYESATQRRPSPMLEFAYCKNVRVEGITLTNAAGWTMRPIACESVYIRGIRVRNPIFAPNTDGMDLTACRNVFVSDCDIATGDDAICIKSENSYGELLPTKNITVTNCVLSTCCNGFKIGTATHGVVENIVFSNSIIYNDDNTPLNERATSGIAVEMVDGGMLDGVTISNIRMQNARTPIFIRLGKRTLGAASYLRNVMISGVNATGAIVTSSITGVPGMPVEDITLADISIETSEHGRPEWTRHSVPEQAANYPEARMFGRLSASGLYVRHVNRLRLCNLRLKAEAPDVRPAVVCDDVHDLDISGLQATAPAEGQSVIALHESSDVFVHGCKAPKDTQTFVQVSGASSTGIVLLGNDLSHAAQRVVLKDGAVAASVSYRS
jgi:polygalacturonase